MRLRTTIGLLLAAAPSLLLFASTALAQPRISQSNPEDGAILATPPDKMSICFSEAVTQALNFSVLAPPQGRKLGLTTLLPPDGKCADILLSEPPSLTNGDWTVSWQVTSRQTGETGSGTIRFTVRGKAEVSPSDEASAAQEEGPDILAMALITMGAVLGTGAVGLVLYLIRLRTGFWLHRPPPREGGEGGEHH